MMFYIVFLLDIINTREHTRVRTSSLFSVQDKDTNWVSQHLGRQFAYATQKESLFQYHKEYRVGKAG